MNLPSFVMSIRGSATLPSLPSQMRSTGLKSLGTSVGYFSSISL